MEPSAKTQFACHCVLGWCLSSTPGAGEALGNRRQKAAPSPKQQSVISNRCLVYLLLINSPLKTQLESTREKTGWLQLEAETAAW